MFWAIARRTLRSDSDPIGPIEQTLWGQSRNPASLRLLSECTREFASGTILRRRTPFTHLQQFGYYLPIAPGATADAVENIRGLLKFT